MGTHDNNASKTTWELLRFRAFWLLEHPFRLHPVFEVNHLRTHIPRLRLWYYPDGPWGLEPKSLTLFEPFDHTEHQRIIREATWESRNDWERLHGLGHEKTRAESMQPTCTVRDGAVNAEQLERLVASGRELSVPLTWPEEKESVSCDGGETGFEFCSTWVQPQPALRLVGSCDTPDQWPPIEDWVHQLWAFFDGCLNDAARCGGEKKDGSG